MYPTKKKELSCKRRQNHQSLDGTEKKKITSQTQRKIPIHGCDKEERIQKRTEKYESMDTEAKRDLLNKATSIESCIKQFKRKIREGPYFICTVCN